MSDQKKIKILFRHRSMEMGGVEKVVLSLLNNLSREKFEMTVCLNMNQGELRDEFPDHVRKVYLAEGKESFSENEIIKKFQLFIRRIKLWKAEKNPKIADLILKEKYDVEIAPSFAIFSAVLNSSNKNSKKIGWFHSEINVPKLQPAVPNILESFPRFDHIIYCSQKIKDMMHHYYPDLKYPAEDVIINAIPIDEIKRKAEEKTKQFPEGPVFISIGRLHTRKGFHKLIDAHKKLMDEGFRHSVIVIGDGEEMENLTHQIDENDVKNTFFLYGNQMNPYPYIKKADYFILPSESEAWPLVIAEALVLQKPIIATNVGDVGDMIEDGKTGYLIQYDTDEIYQAMKKFLTEPHFVSHIKKNLTDIEKQFDNKKIFEAVEHIITNLVEN